MNMKYSFLNDYSEGAYPDILKALEQTNMVQEIGYGEDSFSLEAVKLIKEKIENPDANVHFISAGTLANLVVLSSLLKPYESVIAADSAHICVHEAGAIEATGHKINVVENVQGKIKSKQIIKVVEEHTNEHMVAPGAVFVSNSTELGTVYRKGELEEISKTCKENDLYLYLDGARLGMGLTSAESDLSLQELSALVDVFYIGGTKNGALFGEAIVINNPDLQKNFRFLLKQRGALLAKGRAVGVQFLELFKDELYFDLARHANGMAVRLTEGIRAAGFDFLSLSSTNQIFPILPNELIGKLEKMYGFYIWSKLDDSNSSIRLVTSWATKEEAVNEFLEDLYKLK